MCGRYTIETEEEVMQMRMILDELNTIYIGSSELKAMKTGEIFPTNIVPVLAGGEAGRSARLMAWGFPGFNDKGVIINARAETALEKPMFRNSLQNRRCVIPSTGFYEWKHDGGKAKKEKYLIRLPGEDMLYMAGFYNLFTDKSGKPYQGFVILTAEANESMAPLHSRMPVILNEKQCANWIGDFTESVGILKKPYAGEFDIRQAIA